MTILIWTAYTLTVSTTTHKEDRVKTLIVNDLNRTLATEDIMASCPTCGGEGLEYPTPSFSESHPLPVPCPDCDGKGTLVFPVGEEPNP